jgi:DNA-binding NarL/FixJ family response regulator
MPARTSSALQTVTDASSSSTSPTRPIRVALVEDDQGFRELLCVLFSQSPGFSLAGAYKDVPSAVAGLRKNATDVLLMDIHLPGTSGIDGVREALAINKNVTVLMLTAFDDHDKVFASLQAGAVGYLLKRSAPVEILEAIQDSLAGGSPMSGPIARMVVQSFREPAKLATSQDLLSKREHELLTHLAEGLRYKEIADRMEVSINTIRSYIRRVYQKLQAQSRTEAIRNYHGPR